MYGIAIRSEVEDGELAYWAGDEVFSVYPEDARGFPDEPGAQAALGALRQTLPNLSPTAHVILLPEEE